MTTGEKIAKTRKSLGISQADLATKLNVSRQSVSKWESDAVFPEISRLIQMATIFDCSIDFLVRYDIDDPHHVLSTESQVDTSIPPQTVLPPFEPKHGKLKKILDLTRLTGISIIAIISILLLLPYGEIISGPFLGHQVTNPLFTVIYQVLLVHFSAVLLVTLNRSSSALRSPAFTVFLVSTISAIISSVYTGVYKNMVDLPPELVVSLAILLIAIPTTFVFCLYFRKGENKYATMIIALPLFLLHFVFLVGVMFFFLAYNVVGAIIGLISALGISLFWIVGVMRETK